MAGDEKAVKTAFFVNLCIFVIKLGAALITRSAGMLAEAIHSLADTGNQVLLLLGLRRSRREPDEAHPFGYGKEEYFWSFIVAMMLFVLGGLYSVYEGAHKILHPDELKHVYINFIILGVSIVMEGYSWAVARKAFGKCTLRGLYETLKRSKDANIVVVFVEDTGALIGLCVAVIGNLLAFLLHEPVFDAASSVAIGVLLLVLALFLAVELRKLLVGERIEAASITRVGRILGAHPGIRAIGGIKTMQLGGNSCLIAVDIDFDDGLLDKEVDLITDDLRKRIKEALPEAKHIYLNPVKTA